LTVVSEVTRYYCLHDVPVIVLRVTATKYNNYFCAQNLQPKTTDHT